MNEDVFSNREDWVKAYGKRRKSMPEDEIDDLINCLFGYLKEVTKDKETYAVRIGELGFMYKKFKPELKKSKGSKIQSSHERIDKMIVEVCTNNDSNRNPLIRKDYVKKQYKGMSIEEIQDYINNAEEV
jgi:hypothetical protein